MPKRGTLLLQRGWKWSVRQIFPPLSSISVRANWGITCTSLQSFHLTREVGARVMLWDNLQVFQTPNQTHILRNCEYTSIFQTIYKHNYNILDMLRTLFLFCSIPKRTSHCQRLCLSAHTVAFSHNLIKFTLINALYSSFSRWTQASPSRGPAFVVNKGIFCTVAFVVGSNACAIGARSINYGYRC